jgi:hypothetical protein
MAYPPVTVPPFPNVPLSLGVPALARSILFPPTPTPAPISTDGLSSFQSSPAPSWAILDSSNNPAIQADTFVSLEFSGEYRISDFPLEPDAFESYDKVQQPFQCRVVLAQGGTSPDRAQFLTDLETLRASLDLYTIFTPDASYENVNVDHVDYMRKSDKGLTLITADIWFVQIRVQATQQFTSTAAPGGADPASGGPVQPQPPTSAQTAAAQPPGGS